jgi:hypothetical protein
MGFKDLRVFGITITCFLLGLAAGSALAEAPVIGGVCGAIVSLFAIRFLARK